MGDENTIKALRAAADRFHKILSTFTARRLLAEAGVRPRPMPDKIRQKLAADAYGTHDGDIERICADGFEECVIALAALGAPDVAIRSCNPSEEPSDG